MLSVLQNHIALLQSSLDNPLVQWKQIVLALLWLVFGFETVLSLRQYKLYRLETPPATLASHVDLDTFRKSQVYGKDKARFGFFTSAVGQLMSVALVYYDVYAWSWTVSGRALHHFGQSDAEIPRSIVWMMIMFVLRELPIMPLTLYRNFVIEERHGFNKMTVRT